MAAGACATSDEAGRPPPAPPATSTTVEGTTTSNKRLPAEHTVTVEPDDYAIAVGATSVPAGRVTVAVANRDSVPHDLVLIATDLASEHLPTSGTRVDESSPDIEVLARTPTLPPDGTGNLTVLVQPGRYLLVCTVPHHYVRETMVAALVGLEQVPRVGGSDASAGVDRFEDDVAR